MRNFQNRLFAGRLYAGRLFREPDRGEQSVFVPLGTARIKVPAKKRRKDTDDDVLMFLLR